MTIPCGLSAFLPLALLLAGCSMSGGMAAEKAAPSNRCSSDDGCAGSGSKCDESLGICVSGGRARRSLLVEVTPAGPGGGVGGAPEYFEWQGEAGVAPASFTLGPRVFVEGIVRWDGAPSSAEGPFASTVELSPAGGFPASLMPPVVVRTGQPEPSYVGEGTDTYFSMTVPAGTYTLRVVPEAPYDEFLPPWEVLSSEELADPRFLTVDYPAGGTMLGVRGAVARNDGNPLPAMSVWVADAATLRRVSTIDRTGAGPESFSVAMFPPAMNGLRGAEFVVVVAPTQETAGYPTIRFGPYVFAQLDADEDGVVSFEADASLVFPPLSVPIKYMATVEAAADGGAQAPVEGVRVKFSTQEVSGGGIERSYEMSAVTNSDGQIAGADGSWGVWLIRGDYAVTLTPPAGSGWQAMKVSSVRVNAEEGVQMGQAFVLEEKGVVRGTVVRESDGRPAGAVTIEAYPVSGVAAGSASAQTVVRFDSGQSGGDGAFALPLDRGLYDLLFIPEAGSLYPRLWLDNVEAAEGPGAPLTVPLPDPVPFEGSVKDGAGAAAAGATVKVHTLVYSPVPGEAPSTRIAWEGAAAAAGTFTALLAP